MNDISHNQASLLLWLLLALAPGAFQFGSCYLPTSSMLLQLGNCEWTLYLPTASAVPTLGLAFVATRLCIRTPQQGG
jgi:hypothetical protein